MGFSALLHPQNKEVGQKLGLATALMFTLPILAYYIAAHVFREKTHPDNWAGGAAIAVTNGIVFWYCYTAYMEDREDRENENDEDRPRVGIYKKRVD